MARFSKVKERGECGGWRVEDRKTQRGQSYNLHVLAAECGAGWPPTDRAGFPADMLPPLAIPGKKETIKGILEMFLPFRTGFSVFLQNSCCNRKESGGALMPFGNALESKTGTWLGGRRELGDEFLEDFDPGVASGQSGQEPLAQKSGHEGTDFETGDIAVAAAVFLPNNGSEVLKVAQPLAGGAFADLNPGDDLVHGKGRFLGEEETVDGPVRTRVAENLRQIGKKGDQFLLENVLCRDG